MGGETADKLNVRSVLRQLRWLGDGILLLVLKLSSPSPIHAYGGRGAGSDSLGHGLPLDRRGRSWMTSSRSHRMVGWLGPVWR